MFVPYKISAHHFFSCICSPSSLSSSSSLSHLFPKQTTAYAINHPYHSRSRSGRSCTIQHILHHRAQCRRGYWTSQVIHCKLFTLPPSYTYIHASDIHPCIVLPTSTLRAVQPNCMIRPLHQGNDVLHMVRIVMEPTKDHMTKNGDCCATIKSSR